MAQAWRQQAASAGSGDADPESESESISVPKWMEDVDEDAYSRDTLFLPFMQGLFESVQNGIFFVTSMAIVMFLAIGVGWFLVYQIDSVKEQIITKDFSNAFGPITFIIALISNELIRQARAKTTSRTTMYGDLVSNLEILIRKFAGMRLAIIHEGPDREWRRNPTEYTGSSAPENAQIVHKQLDDLFMYLFIMARHSYTLFQSHDPYADYLDFVDANKYAKFENVVRTPIGAQLKYETETSIFKNAILYMETHLIHLNHSGVIPSSIYLSTVEVLNSISNQVGGIVMSQRIAVPKIFDQLYYVALGFWLLILVPLQVYTSVQGWIIMIYPLILIIYLGPIIYGFWLGDPFMRYPRFDGGANVLSWRHKLYAEIQSLLFEDVYLDIVDRVSHSKHPETVLMEELRRRNTQIRGDE
jgi:hypothetical protein